jgi:SAM-dependent methyltransferase
MSVDRVVSVAGPLLASAEALAAVGAALRLRGGGGGGDPAPPDLVARLDAVLDALGLRQAVDALDSEEAASLLSLVAGSLAQAADLVAAPRRAGWDHENADILTMQGSTSALLADVFQRRVVPVLAGDLAGRLDGGGASFLDVGAGVGALAIAMCRVWPALGVVGLDPWEPALRLAREHVVAAGLGDRIELRQERVERMRDTDRHDLAWLPTFFISAAVLAPGIERVHAGLRAGGCAILGLYARPDDALGAAAADLRTLRQGGASVTPQQLAGLMTTVGFVDVDSIADPAWPVEFVVGRRRGAP